jgi:hypothetical protein
MGDDKEDRVGACYHIRVGEIALLQHVQVAQNSLTELMFNVLPLVSGDFCATLYFWCVEVEMSNFMHFINYPK